MRQILVCALMFVIASSIFFVVGKERQREEKGGAQATDSKQVNDQVEVKTDRFSGVTTVKLKPQVILDKPDHQMTIEIETKLGEKGQLDFEKDDVKAETRFRSLYKGSVDFGDQELHLLIDGKPLDIGKTPGIPKLQMKTCAGSVASESVRFLLPYLIAVVWNKSPEQHALR